MPEPKPQIVYGPTIISTQLFVLAGRSVKPLRHPDGQPVVLQAVSEDEPTAQFWDDAGPGLEAERARLQAELDARDEAPEPEAPKPSVVDELVPDPQPEEPVAVIDPKRVE